MIILALIVNGNKIKLEESIRKRFKEDGLWYNGWIESIILYNIVYYVKYNDGDEESMTKSDIRKYWVEKEKVNKKSSSNKR